MRNKKPLHRNTDEKSLSFNGRRSEVSVGTGKLRRPKTFPNFASETMIGIAEVFPSMDQKKRKLTKLLLNVTIEGSIGPLQILMKPETTVSDLISSAVSQYVKEARRPVLPISDPSGFDLHYSQFSLQSLNREEKLVLLGSRNFFLCKRKVAETSMDEGFSGLPANSATGTSYSTSSCKERADKAAKTGFGRPWFKFIGSLQ